MLKLMGKKIGNKLQVKYKLIVFWKVLPIWTYKHIKVWPLYICEGDFESVNQYFFVKL